MIVYFHQRAATDSVPGGFTVSRSEDLPDGDFVITEFTFGRLSLWFIDDDEFSADEREAVYNGFVEKVGETFLKVVAKHDQPA